MSQLAQIMPFLLQLKEQGIQQNALQKPSRLPEIVSMILSNKRTREQLKQNAAEMEMKQSISERSLQAEREKTSAQSKAGMMDALSRIIASGEDIPPEFAQMLQGGSDSPLDLSLGTGGMNVSGNLRDIKNFFRGGKPGYLPPAPIGSSSSEFRRELALTTSADEVRDLFTKYPHISRRNMDEGMQRLNALETGKNKIPPNQGQIDKILSGNTADEDQDVVSDVLLNYQRQPDTIKKNKEEDVKIQREGEIERANIGTDVAVLKESGRNLNLSAAQKLKNIFSIKSSSPELFQKQYSTPEGRFEIEQLQRDWSDEVVRDWDKDTENKPLSKLRTIASQAKEFGVMDYSPDVKDKFFKDTWGPIRTKAVHSDVWGMGFKTPIFETQKGLIDFANQGKELSKIESILGQPNIPYPPNKFVISRGKYLPGVSDRDGFTFPAQIRTVTPKEAEEFWESLKKRAPEMGD